jgi:hypothetical protein
MSRPQEIATLPLDVAFAVSLLAVEGRPERSSTRSILLAMMKSFSCSPLIFLVLSETVA